ncbi:MAG TPA: hypothetical protein VKB93_12995 [Thermoanaerobaculia bacterium]|nr:hypothetical protein [Thermoanaerobaculia bacterium]
MRILFLLLFAASAFADTFAVRKNIEYAPQLRFDLYRPAGDAVVPVMIFANVGISGMKDWPSYVRWGEAVAAAGLAAVHYEATDFPDFDKLVAALQKRAAEFHIDPTRIVLWSGSTNVRLGLPYAMDPKREYIRGAIVYYGAADVPSIRLDVPVFYARAGREVRQLNQAIDALIVRALAANAPWTIVNNGHGVHAFDVYERDNDVTRDIVARSIAFAKAVTATNAYAAGAAEAEVAGAFQRGEWDAVIDGYRRLLAGREDGENRRRLGLALMERMRFAEALPELEKAWQGGRTGARDTMLPAAQAAAGAGNTERALYWLDLALAQPFIQLPEVLAVVDRWKELLAREPVIDQLAQQLLKRGRVNDAVALFRLNTERFAESSNAWDSLSKGLEKSGAKEDAAAAAKKARELRLTRP